MQFCVPVDDGVWWESVTSSVFSVFFSDVWSLGCVLYELCALQHPVLPLLCLLCVPQPWLSPEVSHVLLCLIMLEHSNRQWKEGQYFQLSLNTCGVFWQALMFLFSPISLHLFSVFQFQASSWKSLILKVCRGAYPPLPRHLPYELLHLMKQIFKTNPKDRPSVQTILTSHRVSKLLRSHLPSQVKNSSFLFVLT